MSTVPTADTVQDPVEDVWIPTCCEVCLCQCPIVVRRVNGVVVKVQGNPQSQKYQGIICGKGASAPMFVHDANRVDYPLLRTNPDKGHGVDPGWKRISWSEALDLAAEKLSQTIAEDPRKVIFYLATMAFSSPVLPAAAFMGACGGGTLLSGASVHCGNSEHAFSFSRQSMSDCPDWQYTDYVLQLGINVGAASAYRTRLSCLRSADARSRGMKLTIVDPVGVLGSEIADEWVPIHPGTDGALLMAMAHVLVHEMNVVDVPYLTSETNLPYLITQDGLYLRDAAGRPMMFDPVDGAAKPFDGTFEAVALDGTYVVDGTPCRTAYAAVKEALLGWTPERASEVTGIAAGRIRRMTAELAEAAKVGATTVIDGKRLRYRPAALVAGRGLTGHDNTAGTWMALMIVGELLGLTGAVGGSVYAGAVSEGFEPGMYSWNVEPGPDGIMSGYFYLGPFQFPFAGYPIPEPSAPQSLGLSELNPLPFVSPVAIRALADPQRFGLDFDTANSFFISIGGNWVYNHANPDIYLEAFKKCFTVSMQTYLNDSVNAVADLVLPGASHFEKLSVPQPLAHQYQQTGYPGNWECYIRQPVIEPVLERRDESEVLIDLMDRVGARPMFNQILGAMMGLKEPWQIGADDAPSWTEIVDRYCKSHFGDDHDLQWFKENGIVSWPATVEEWYWPQFSDAGRLVVYHEHLLRNAAKMREIVEAHGIDYPVRGWSALPFWQPCAQCRERDEAFDMAAVYYKHPLSSQSYGRANVLLDDALSKDVSMDYFLMNRETAKKKGIADGDQVVIRSRDGATLNGVVRLSEVVYPSVIAVCSGLTNESPHSEVVKGKNFNRLLRNEWEYTDNMVQALDTDRAVSVSRDRGQRRR